MTTIAVLGTGSIGSRHLRLLRGAAGVKVIAVPVRPGRAADLNREGYEVCGSLGETAQRGARHAIVATDTGRHASDAAEALGLGMAVLVEKPLAAEKDSAVELCRNAEQARRELFVGCVLRFSESLGRFRELLGGIGDVHSVRIECRSYLPDWRQARPFRDSYSARAGEGGVLRDLIHELDYAVWIFGWPNAVRADLRNLGRLNIEAEETAELAWVTDSGASVSIGLDYLSRPARRRMRVCGTGGTLEWDGISGTTTLTPALGSGKTIVSAQGRDAMLQAEHLAFLAAGRGGGGDGADPRLATFAEGARALAICDAARLSSRTRREEIVDYRGI